MSSAIDHTDEVARRFNAVQDLITEMINIRRASIASARVKQNDMSMDIDTLPQDNSDLARQIGKCVHKGTLLLSSLKDLNRDVYQQERNLKNDLAEQKLVVANVHLGYQNILYQRKYLLDEIARCRAMETLYQDIPLISIEEFNQSAPSHLLQTVNDNTTNASPNSNNNNNNNNNSSREDDMSKEHQRMLNRLQFELEERKRYDAEKRRLMGIKAQLLKANKTRKLQLNKFEKQLETYIEASQPIQDLFKDPAATSIISSDITQTTTTTGELGSLEDKLQTLVVEGSLEESGRKRANREEDEDDQEHTTMIE
ncbi:hypothetical protein BGZ94_003288 [Podila epigama]|nr:hypothetical protein BGZ94_003288 [Podila epigama]